MGLETVSTLDPRLMSQVVETGSGDVRDGTYSLNGTSTELPVFCADECVYTKDGASGQDFYCFGPGDVDSTCEVP